MFSSRLTLSNYVELQNTPLISHLRKDYTQENERQHNFMKLFCSILRALYFYTFTIHEQK